MNITPEKLQLIKEHARIDGTFDDALLKEYFEWAYLDIIDAVTGEEQPDYTFFDENRLFNAAVLPLTAYYYDNRLAFDSSERNLSYAPHMVLSVVHKLRYKYTTRS